ncbi:MAG: hypothetical protein JST11_19840 [Acidobacteria bacterium]|nr:hypothetical protein [Acidobacteriota bacterium]
MVRTIAFALPLLLLASCASPPPPPTRAAQPRPDPVTEAWYGETVNQLAALTRQGESLFQARKLDAAGKVVAGAQPLAERLLQAPRPTLAALEAAGDLDDLYGRILLANHNVGWARIVFQKNLVRWKVHKPATPDTERRRKLASERIAACDRELDLPSSAR